jgi:ketosteroid isomerase-like protein
MSTSEIATVLAWHDALNASDVDTVLSLASADIEVASADGAAQGLAALRDWATDPDVTLTPGRMYYRDGVVVVEEAVDGSADEAAAFRVVHDRITSIFRHTDVDSALSATGMTPDDVVG